MAVKLDLSSLENAFAQLETNYGMAEKEREMQTPYFEPLRTACIKGFEMLCELSIKFIRRALEEMGEDGNKLAEMAFRDVLRLTAENGLIADPVLWFGFCAERNKAAHTHDTDVVQEIYRRIPIYIEAAEDLLSRLRQCT